jgi:predicted dehydrogenase
MIKNCKYKVALIGCGARGQAHFDAYEFIADARVTACHDLDPARLEKFAERNKIQAYSSPSAMLRNEKPDMVHIVTPVPGRVELMKLAADNGVPLCTIEKPVALGVDDWQQISELANGSVTKFGVCHQLRWHPFLRKCREAINSGKLGKLKFIYASAGENPVVQGTHLLSYARFLNNESPIIRVFANASAISDRIPFHPAPEQACAIVEFENGCRAVWECGKGGLICEGPESWMHVRLQALTEHGSALFEEFGRWRISGAAEYDFDGGFGSIEEWEKNNNIAQVGFHNAMFDWLREGSVPGCSLNEALHEWECILAMYTSAVEHHSMNLNSFVPEGTIMEKLNSL